MHDGGERGGRDRVGGVGGRRGGCQPCCGHCRHRGHAWWKMNTNTLEMCKANTNTNANTHTNLAWMTCSSQFERPQLDRSTLRLASQSWTRDRTCLRCNVLTNSFLFKKLLTSSDIICCLFYSGQRVCFSEMKKMLCFTRH